MPPIIELPNFAPNVDELRAHAFATGFIDWDAPDGETYKRIAIVDVPQLQERIEKVMGPVEMLGMAYRLNFGGEMPNAAVHSDIGWGTHALVLYMQDGPGGTAFWEHKETGTIGMEPGDLALMNEVGDSWNDESAWRQRKMVKCVKGDAVIYESRLFHSRYPFAAFGDGPEDGRMIAVAFFTPIRSE